MCSIGLGPATSPLPHLTPGQRGDKATQFGNLRPRMVEVEKVPGWTYGLREAVSRPGHQNKPPVVTGLLRGRHGVEPRALPSSLQAREGVAQ